MRKNKKEVPVAQRFSAFLVFSLVDINGGSSSRGGASSEQICRLEFDICAGERCPKATENFRQLVSGAVTVGEKRNSRQATYKGTYVLRATNDMLQLGDTAYSADGKAQDTIYGTLIEDEAMGVVPHRFGTLTLANSGPNSGGSQFCVIANEEVEALPHLDSRHVSLGFLKGGEEAREQLRKLHDVCCGLVLDRTGVMPRGSAAGGATAAAASSTSGAAAPDAAAAAAIAGSGVYVVLSDCGIVAEQ